MSLRSGSPCTSTSRPMSSCRRITRSTSSVIRLRYSVVVDLALAQAGARRADLARLREGADRGGREQRQAEALVLCVAARRERALAAARRRRSPSPAARAPAGCACAASCAGPRAPSQFASSSAEIASRPSLVARVSVATSSSFCTANDIQLSTSGSRRGSLVLSTGECWSELEVETTTLSPACLRSSSIRSRLAARSLIHTLRPLTTPANRVLSSGQPCFATRSRLCGP